MRLTLIFLCVLAFGQPVPPQFSGLSTSTDNLYPYTRPPLPKAGEKYIDTYHPDGDGFVSIQRLPALPGNCSVRGWSTGLGGPAEWPVSYAGKYYYIPSSVNGMASPQTKPTNAPSPAGTNVLFFASTAVPTSNFIGGFRSDYQYTVSGVNIPTGTTVVSFTPTSVTLSANVTGVGIASGANITFTTFPGQKPWVEITQEEACDRQSTVVSYSARQPFNSDGTRFIVLPRTLLNTAAFYKTNPVRFEKFLTGMQYSSLISTNGSETWDKDNPDEMYFWNNYQGAKFSKVNVVTGALTHLYTFQQGVDCPAGYDIVQDGGAGNSSEDQRYWGAFCKNGATGAQGGVLVYDKTLNKVVSKADFTQLCGGGTHSIDLVTMSPSGKYFLIAWSYAEARENVWSTCHGTELYDRDTLTSRGMVFSYGSGHSNTGRDVNGREIMVVTPGAHKRSAVDNFPGNRLSVTALDDVHPPPYDITRSYVRAYQLPCTATTVQNGADPYFGCKWGTGTLGGNTWHISARGSMSPSSLGWILGSTVTDGGVLNGEGSGWGKSENIAFQVDTLLPNTVPERKAIFRRISRNLSSRYHVNMPACTASGDYWQEAHATSNQDFSKVLFSGSWLTQCGAQNTFIVELNPGDVNPPPLPEGAVGVRVARVGKAAVATVGLPGMGLSTSCVVTVTQGTTTVATATSAWGFARRQIAFGDLPQGALTFSVLCGNETGAAATAATPAVTGTRPIQVAASGKFSIEYGAFTEDCPVVPDGSILDAVAGRLVVPDQPVGGVFKYRYRRGNRCGITKFLIP